MLASKKKGDPADAIIDPKGDSIIILKHPSTTFAPWYEEHERRSTLSRNNTATPQDNMNASKMSVGTPSPKDEFITAKSFLVSSRHLQLASARLREILKKAGKNDNGLYVIEDDEEWTFKVFLRFLLIIHHRNFHKEFENIGDAKMDTMAELLTLAGSYGSQEAFRFYVRCWEVNFDPGTTPTHYSRDLVLSIYVRWVQKFKATFETLTGMAMQTMKYDRPMQTLGLPLPEAIAHGIQHRRNRALNKLTLGLREVAKQAMGNFECQYHGPNRYMSMQCGAMIIGCIVKFLGTREVLDPEWDGVLDGVSLDDIFKRYRKVEKMCSQLDEEEVSDLPACRLKNHVGSLMHKVWGMVKGLKVSDIQES